jgi:3-hydroxymyristoyl/3-hydroxydecanoyl-(acyl carrier protein) dehydratase
MSRLLPEILAVRRGPEGSALVTLDLHVAADIVHFAGHFPGLAMLPGVLQIDWAARLAREYLALNGEFKSMENIKFQALILPDARLALTLNWNAVKGHLEFSYATSQRKYSTGRIVFGEHA